MSPVAGPATLMGDRGNPDAVIQLQEEQSVWEAR